MPFDDRTWTVDGTELIGSAADNRPPIRVSIEALDDSIAQGDLNDLATKMADIHNEHGGTRFTHAEFLILGAVAAIEATGWPATTKQIAANTGLSYVWSRQVVNRLVVRGYLQRSEGSPQAIRTAAAEPVAR